MTDESKPASTLGATGWDGFPADEYSGLEDCKVKGNRPGVRVVVIREFGARQEVSIFLSVQDAKQLFLGLSRVLPALADLELETQPGTKQ